jgi:hypothetical protein
MSRAREQGTGRTTTKGFEMRCAGEKAMALVDGQLAPAEVPTLVQELARNAALVAELQGYLATSQGRIGQVFAAKADEPVPPRLVDAIRSAPVGAAPATPAAPPKQARAGRLATRVSDWLGRSCRVPAWSLAAAPALAAAAAFVITVSILPTGLPVGQVGRDGPQAHAGAMGALASTELGAALERAGSGKDTTLASVRPMLTFASKDAGWCRQFEVRGSARQTSHGLACRGLAGNWRVVALTPPSASGKYLPAGADRRKLVDDMVTSMIAGEPLSPEGEAVVIEKRWQL